MVLKILLQKTEQIDEENTNEDHRNILVFNNIFYSLKSPFVVYKDGGLRCII